MEPIYYSGTSWEVNPDIDLYGFVHCGLPLFRKQRRFMQRTYSLNPMPMPDLGFKIKFKMPHFAKDMTALRKYDYDLRKILVCNPINECIPCDG